MSFALTKEQILRKEKFVTRRNGWKNLKEGDLIQPVEKCMGLKKGEKQILLGDPIEVESVIFEQLNEITDADVVLEGFPEMTKEEFIAMYCKANKCKPDKIITRIAFEYSN